MLEINQIERSGGNYVLPRKSKKIVTNDALFPNSIAIAIRAHREALKMGASPDLANKAVALGIASFLQLGTQEQLPDIVINNCGRLIAELIVAGQPVPFTWQQIFEKQLSLINANY